MKINRIHLEAYGCFENKTFDFSPHLNVILGPNEAGKSTMKDAQKTLLYGIKPIDREKHPYSQWQSGFLSLSGVFSFKGELFELERRLMNSPRGQWIKSSTGEILNIKNAQIPFITNVHERLFQSVFFLESSSLDHLESQTWERIQEQLLYFQADVSSVTPLDALRQLGQKTDKLWRQDRRGKPEIRSVEAEIKEKESQKYHCLEKEKDYIKQLDEKDFLEKKKVDLEEKIKLLGQKIDEMSRLLPIVEKKNKIQEIKEKIHPYRQWLEDDYISPAQFKELRVRISQLESEIQALEKEKNEQIHLSLKNQLSTEEKQLAEHPHVMMQMEKHFNEKKRLHSDLEAILLEIKKYEAEQRKINQYLSPLQREIATKKVIDFDQIKEMMQAYRDDELIYKKRFFAYIILAIPTVLTLGVYNYFSQRMEFWLLWIALSLFFATAMTLEQKKISFLKKSNHLIEEKILSFLPLSGISFEKLKNDLSYSGLDRMKSMQICIEELNRLEEKKREKVDEAQAHGEAFKSYQSQLPSPSSSLQEEQYLFYFSIYETLMANYRAFQLDEQEIKRLSLLLEEKNDPYQKDLKKLNHLSERFKSLGYESPEEAVFFLESLKKLDIQKEALEHEIFSSAETLEMQTEISPYNLLRLKEEQQILIAEREDVAEKLMSCQMNLSNSRVIEEIKQLEDDLQALYEKRKRIIRKKDTFLLAQEIISIAEEKYRLKHQPQMMERVSQYLCQITEGTYEKVIIEQGACQEQLLYIQTKWGYLSLDKAFSKGTVQQLYFAFRSALLDEIDPEGMCPFILDDAFVHWDKSRLKGLMPILEEISASRQVFLYTCHPETSELLMKYIKNSRLTKL